MLRTGLILAERMRPDRPSLQQLARNLRYHDHGRTDTFRGTINEGAEQLMNNPLARQALKKAASTVNSGVRQGVSSIIEQETATLRNRVAHLERELADLRDRLDRIERNASNR